MGDPAHGGSHQAGAEPTPGAGATLQLVTFTLGAQLYCVDTMSVREIRASDVITPLPGAPDYLPDVINWRGTIVPIIDPKTCFGLERAAHGRIAVASQLFPIPQARA